MGEVTFVGTDDSMYQIAKLAIADTNTLKSMMSKKSKRQPNNGGYHRRAVGRLKQKLEQQAHNKNRRNFKMLEPFFFALGLANNGFLIFIFLIRKNHFALLQRIGWVYLLLAIPAIYAIFLVQQEQKTPRYTVFLGIFLAFLAIEALYDWILKIPFREKMNWKQLAPYVALYISMNYGFVVMVWKYYSLIGGIILLGLFVVQIIANIVTHPRATIKKNFIGENRQGE